MSSYRVVVTNHEGALIDKVVATPEEAIEVAKKYGSGYPSVLVIPTDAAPATAAAPTPPTAAAAGAPDPVVKDAPAAPAP